MTDLCQALKELRLATERLVRASDRSRELEQQGRDDLARRVHLDAKVDYELARSVVKAAAR